MQRHFGVEERFKFLQDRFPASRDEEPKVSADPKIAADQFLAEVKKRVADKAGETHSDDKHNAVGLGEGQGGEDIGN